ncbi:hypothetical protein LLG46_12795 [bacterium]|nr:hypothetical protein [bacterium]
MHKGDLTGRIIGMLVFLAGVGILVFVFVAAFQYFNSNAIVLKPAAPVSATQTTTSRLGESVVLLMGRIALLIVMAIAGSQVASRGIQLYFAATGFRRPTMPEVPPEAV